jgi:hypothetical protein
VELELGLVEELEIGELLVETLLLQATKRLKVSKTELNFTTFVFIMDPVSFLINIYVIVFIWFYSNIIILQIQPSVNSRLQLCKLIIHGITKKGFISLFYAFSISWKSNSTC